MKAKSDYICGVCGFIGQPKRGQNHFFKLLTRLFSFIPFLPISPLRFILSLELICQECSSVAVVPLESQKGQQAYLDLEKLKHDRQEFSEKNLH
jgi:hypothetical protein